MADLLFFVFIGVMGFAGGYKTGETSIQTTIIKDGKFCVDSEVYGVKFQKCYQVNEVPKSGENK